MTRLLIQEDDYNHLIQQVEKAERYEQALKEILRLPREWESKKIVLSVLEKRNVR